MNLQIGKWGNSLAVRIPSAVAKALGLRDGGELSAKLVDGSLVLQPGRSRIYSLQELVSKITPENRHEGVDWGGPVGREEW